MKREEKKLTPMKAIRNKCLDCCAGGYKAIRECKAENCPLWDYRMGKNPARKGTGNKRPKFIKTIE